jgi:hypothetical protein
MDTILRIPKDINKVTVGSLDNIDTVNGKVVGGRYIKGGSVILIKRPVNRHTLYHEFGHHLDYTGDGWKSEIPNHEFNKLVKMVTELPTIQNLKKIELDGYYNKYNEQIILDEDTKKYVNYLLLEVEIFGRLFEQYMLNKFKNPFNYSNSSINHYWEDEKEWQVIEEYMDTMFEKMGWIKSEDIIDG